MLRKKKQKLFSRLNLCEWNLELLSNLVLVSIPLGNCCTAIQVIHENSTLCPCYMYLYPEKILRTLYNIYRGRESTRDK